MLLAPPLFYRNFAGVPVAPDRPCWGQCEQFGREIIFKVFQDDKVKLTHSYNYVPVSTVSKDCTDKTESKPNKCIIKSASVYHPWALALC